MQDGPGYNTPVPAQTLTVNEAFTDYLMFQSGVQGSVWIALSQLSWSWTAATAAGQGKVNGVPTTGNASTPSGAAAFPSWVNTGTNILANGPVEGSSDDDTH